MTNFVTGVDIHDRLVALLNADADWKPLFPNAILRANPKSCTAEGSGLPNESPCVALDLVNSTSSDAGLGGTGIGSNIDNYQSALLIFVAASSEDDASKAQLVELSNSAVQILKRYSMDPNGLWYRISFGDGDSKPVHTDFIYSTNGFRVAITYFDILRYYIKP